MPLTIGTTEDENAVVGTTGVQGSVRGEPFGFAQETMHGPSTGSWRVI